MDHSIGDRYRILDSLGSGGMGEVFLAHDEVFDRHVALKVMHPHYAGDGDSVKRFKGEARSAASLSHPNIVSIYDSGETEEGTYYIAMEYLPGGTLKEAIERRGSFSAVRAVAVAAQIAAALGTAHDQGVIHRDIKPHNVLVTESGDVKVTDFGIATAAATSSTLTATGTVLGTAHYISPEQAIGERVGPESDLYSLGVTLYEMVTGKLPFEGDTTLGVAMKHVNTPVESPREVDPQIPRGLEAVILRLLSKYPGDRYPGASELIRDLELLQEGLYPQAAYIEDTKASRHSHQAPTHRRRRRRRRAVAMGVPLAVLALLGGVWGSIQTGAQAPSPVDGIGAGISVAEGVPEVPNLGSGASSAPTGEGNSQAEAGSQGDAQEERSETDSAVSGGSGVASGKASSPDNPGSGQRQGTTSEQTVPESTGAESADTPAAVATGEEAPVSSTENSEPASASGSGSELASPQEDSGAASGATGGSGSGGQEDSSTPSGDGVGAIPYGQSNEEESAPAPTTGTPSSEPSETSASESRSNSSSEQVESSSSIEQSTTVTSPSGPESDSGSEQPSIPSSETRSEGSGGAGNGGDTNLGSAPGNSQDILPYAGDEKEAGSQTTANPSTSVGEEPVGEVTAPKTPSSGEFSQDPNPQSDQYE